MRRVHAFLSILLALSLLLVAGCGGSSSSKNPSPAVPNKEAAPAPAPPAQEANKALTPVKVAPGPDGSIIYMSAFLAEGLGTYKKNGLDVTILNTDGGNAASKALMSGEADFALMASDHVVKNRVNGAELVITGYMTRFPGLVFIVQKSLEGKVKSLKDLKGMKVGVSSIGGGTEGATRSYMEKLGMRPEDLEIIAVKDKLIEKWDKGEVAAAMHVSPMTDQLVQDGKAFVLYDLRKEKDTHALYDGSDYPLAVIVTRQDIIDRKPEVVERFMRSILEANQFIARASPEELMAKFPARYTQGYDKKLYIAMIRDNLEQITLDATVSPSGLETVVKSMRKLKLIPADASLNINSLVNLSFVEAARQTARK